MSKAVPKIMVDNSRFEFDLGIKILRAKYKTYDAFKESAYISKEALAQVKTSWETVGDVTVMEALSIGNLEARRICFRYIGVQTIFKELNPELADKQTIKKATKVNKEGKLEAFEDTYELFKVKGDSLRKGSAENTWRAVSDFFILKCSCTSTGREYLIYIQDIWSTQRFRLSGSANIAAGKPDAIEAVAWTIQVEVPEEYVDKIVRAGDCIMVKPKADYKKCTMRHISKKEYLEKVVAES